MKILVALLIFCIAVLLLFGIAAGGAWYAFNYYGQCADPEGETVVFTVESGEHLSTTFASIHL